MQFVLLLALYELRGEHKKVEALNHIRANEYYIFTEEDLKKRTNNERAWENNFAYERHHLVKNGFMSNSGRDRWGITESGKEYFSELYLDVSNVVDLIEDVSKVSPKAVRRAYQLIQDSYVEDGLA